MEKYETLSHGFHIGVNNITSDRICKWLHINEIHWMAFLWYIAEYACIVEFGDNWMKVNIMSEKQLSNFYHKVMKYFPEMWEHNYDIDGTNTLWKSHKKAITSNDILQRIITYDTEKE